LSLIVLTQIKIINKKFGKVHFYLYIYKMNHNNLTTKNYLQTPTVGDINIAAPLLNNFFSNIWCKNSFSITNNQMPSPNGAMVGLNGEMVGLNGEMVGLNGAMVSPNGVMVGTNDETVGLNGVTVAPNNVIVAPNNVIVIPNKIALNLIKYIYKPVRLMV